MLKLKLQYFWPLDAKNWLTGKAPDAGKDWRQEKGTNEDEMVGWHHWLEGHEFEQTPGAGDRQGNLACYSPWGHREPGHNWATELKSKEDRKAKSESCAPSGGREKEIRKVAAAAKLLQLCPTLCDPIDRSPPSSHSWESPGKNTGVGCHCLLWKKTRGRRKGRNCSVGLRAWKEKIKIPILTKKCMSLKTRKANPLVFGVYDFQFFALIKTEERSGLVNDYGSKKNFFLLNKCFFFWSM